MSATIHNLTEFRLKKEIKNACIDFDQQKAEPDWHKLAGMLSMSSKRQGEVLVIDGNILVKHPKE